MLYTYRDFDRIPEQRGVYAFFINLQAIMTSSRTGPIAPVQFQRLVDKVIRSHTLGNPKDVRINLSGKPKSFASYLNLQATHQIMVGRTADQPTEAELGSVATALAKCSDITSPLYIGIAQKQTFRQRFGQHRTEYQRLKSEPGRRRSVIAVREPFDLGGTFAAKLIRRNLEFRHLVFSCTPLSEEELQCAPYLEKVLHALVNPPLSESH